MYLDHPQSWVDTRKPLQQFSFIFTYFRLLFES
jgi:hypothetical protein